MARLVWEGETRLVEADAAEDEPFIGMGLLDGYDLRIQVVRGGAVTIERLP